MLSIVSSVIGAFVSEIAKAFARRTVESKSDACGDLLRLYVVLEELLEQATTLYHSFTEYVSRFDELSKSQEFKVRIRQEMRDCLSTLNRFEKYLKSVFTTLKLLDSSDVSIKVVQVPVSSETLFKKHFMNDLAPRFVADKSGDQYLLRITKKRKAHVLVDKNKLGHVSLNLEELFQSGYLDHQLIDVSQKDETREALKDSSDTLLELRAVVESIRTLLQTNCKERLFKS